MSLTIKIKRLNDNEPSESEIAVPLASIGAATGNVKANRSAIVIFVKDTFKLDAAEVEVAERSGASNETGAPATQIRVKVMSIIGGITTLVVSRKNSIAHLKGMYHRTPGTYVPHPSTGNFELSFNAQVVPDWKILGDHPIDDGDTLLVMVKWE